MIANRKERRAEESLRAKDARKLSKVINNNKLEDYRAEAKKVVKQDDLGNGHAIIMYKWADHIGLHYPISVMILKDGKLFGVDSFMSQDKAEHFYSVTSDRLKGND